MGPVTDVKIFLNDISMADFEIIFICHLIFQFSFDIFEYCLRKTSFHLAHKTWLVVTQQLPPVL